MEAIELHISHGMIEIPKFDGGKCIRAYELGRNQ